MGRPLGSKNTPRIGDNSGLTDEQRKSILFQAVDRIGPLKEQLASISGTMRSVYNEYKADGIPKKDIDFLLRLQGKESDDARDDAARYLQIFTWAHPGAQAELFQDAAE